MKKNIPEYRGLLRHHFIEVPDCINNASGIRIFGRRIRSLVFSTDVAIIRNINADGVIAVYPFTPQPAITHALMLAADMPMFVGVGGGVTRGLRVVNLAMDAEFQGATAVVVNAPTQNSVITQLKHTRAIPVVVTVISELTDIQKRLDAGADMLNVSGAGRTAFIVRMIREKFPNVPILATGGPNEKTIKATIEAGANAITYTPPSNGDLFRVSMDKYRDEQAGVADV